MRDAEELLRYFSQVRPPESGDLLQGIVAGDGLVCGRSASGDFELLAPEASAESPEFAASVGSVHLASGSHYRVDLGDRVVEGRFLRVTLAVDRADLLKAFVLVIAATLPDPVPVSDSQSLIRYLAEILRLLQSDPLPTPEEIKGLWGELWLIRASPDSEAIVRGWHGRSTDKVDFDLDGTLLEVKCHEGRQRIHSLRLDQLELRPEATFLVSLCVAASPGGDSVMDLVRDVSDRLDVTLFRRLMTCVLSVTGENVDLVTDYRFTLWPDVPPIAVPAPKVPRPLVSDPRVSNVSFRVDLSDVRGADVRPVHQLLASLTRSTQSE